MVTFVNTSKISERVRRISAIAAATAVLLALGQTVANSAYADDHSCVDKPDAMRLMNEQLQELQARVKQLEARLNGVTNVPPQAFLKDPAPAEAPSKSPSEAVPPTPLPSQSPQEPSGSNAVAPSVKLRMFGDLGYEVSDQKGETNSFHIGSLDLFMTGNLSEKLSVLGEVLFIPQANNGVSPDVERLMLQYKPNDYFTFAIGRYHSAIGYYNTAFHQGAWFQTAVDRPFMYAFDDQGGFLPLQEVGLTLSGAIPSDRLGLHYVAEMGNGRAHVLGSDPAQNTQDTNNGKSVNFALSSHPSWVSGLETGFSIYHDYLTFSDNINHGELISTAWIAYNSSNYEFLNEAMLVRHDHTMTGAPGVFHTPGFYTLFSRRFGKYRPYFRYSYLNAGVNEPIYGDPADGPVVGRRNGPSLGVRWDFNEHAAVKLQFDRSARRALPSSNALETQFSFAF